MEEVTGNERFVDCFVLASSTLVSKGVVTEVGKFYFILLSFALVCREEGERTKDDCVCILWIVISLPPSHLDRELEHVLE